MVSRQRKLEMAAELKDKERELRLERGEIVKRLQAVEKDRRELDREFLGVLHEQHAEALRTMENPQKVLDEILEQMKLIGTLTSQKRIKIEKNWNEHNLKAGEFRYKVIVERTERDRKNERIELLGCIRMEVTALGRHLQRLQSIVDAENLDLIVFCQVSTDKLRNRLRGLELDVRKLSAMLPASSETLGILEVQLANVFKLLTELSTECEIVIGGEAYVPRMRHEIEWSHVESLVGSLAQEL